MIEACPIPLVALATSITVSKPLFSCLLSDSRRGGVVTLVTERHWLESQNGNRCSTPGKTLASTKGRHRGASNSGLGCVRALSSRQANRRQLPHRRGCPGCLALRPAIAGSGNQTRSRFCLSYCYIARANDLLYFFDLDPTPDRILLAEAAVKAALRLRPDSPEAHFAMADFLFRCLFRRTHNLGTEIGR